MIILKWILEKKVEIIWSGFIWIRMKPVEGSCEHGNEHSGSIKYGLNPLIAE
jgi:hypothetical protein